jgi:hypothetical protein
MDAARSQRPELLSGVRPPAGELRCFLRRYQQVMRSAPQASKWVEVTHSPQLHDNGMLAAVHGPADGGFHVAEREKLRGYAKRQYNRLRVSGLQRPLSE